MRAGSWKGKAGYERAEALVDAMLDFWERAPRVLRVVDLATEEGDQRFRQIRTRLLNALTEALAEVYVGFRDDGRHPPDLDPRAVAGALVAMLAHVSAAPLRLRVLGHQDRQACARRWPARSSGASPARSPRPDLAARDLTHRQVRR